MKLHSGYHILYFRSPGFGLTLVAETTEGSFISAEVASNSKGSENGPSIPEDLGLEAAKSLLEEIYKVRNVQATSNIHLQCMVPQSATLCIISRDFLGY